jgi:hypothetical protein
MEFCAQERYVEYPDQKIGNLICGATTSYGKYWAATRGGQVVSMISMVVPSNVDFSEYRQRASEILSMVGSIKSGKMVIDQNKSMWFVEYILQSELERGAAPNVYQCRTRPKSLDVESLAEEMV